MCIFYIVHNTVKSYITRKLSFSEIWLYRLLYITDYILLCDNHRSNYLQQNRDVFFLTFSQTLFCHIPTLTTASDSHTPYIIF